MAHRSIVLAAIVALLPGTAQAQDASPRTVVSLDELSRTAVVRPVPARVRPPTSAPQPPGKKDSLLNGILIGAGLGAIAGAAGGTAAITCDECAGFNVPLTFGVAGAAVGAAIGAGLDALRRSARESDGRRRGASGRQAAAVAAGGAALHRGRIAEVPQDRAAQAGR